MKKNNSHKTKNSDSVKRGSELESLLHSEQIVQIEKLIVGGNGLARLQFQDKSVVVFVPCTAPHEKVKIKIIQTEKNHLIGELLEIIEPSMARRPAPCEYYQNCGGCNWQHISEAEQVNQKEQILLDLLKKFVPLTEFKLLETVKSELYFGYRNRIQLKHEKDFFGYFKRGRHDIVDIKKCLIAEEQISNQISEIKLKLRPTQELKKYELRINHLNQFEYYQIGSDGEGLSFSQVNNLVNKKLVEAVVSLAKLKKPSFLTELYAGAGNFTFSLAEALSETRIESAELNSKLTVFSNKKIMADKLQKRILAFTTDCESFVSRRELSRELIVLDPPRSGCSEHVLSQISKSGAQNIIYISCHPVNLARDLKTLLGSDPNLRIEHLQIFDMFPQTDHFETLLLLSKS